MMYSQASADVLRAKPSVMVESSVDSGWTSTLLERHRVAPGSRSLACADTNDTHVVVALAGNLRLEAFRGGWRENLFTRGGIVFRPGGEVVRMRSANTAEVELAHIFLSPQEIAEAGEALRRPGQRAPERAVSGCIADDALVLETAKGLFWALRLGASEVYAEQARAWLATHLLARHGAGRVDDLAGPRHDLVDARLSRTIDLVRERFASELTLSALAAEARVSKFHFARLFRDKTGQSPHAYLEGVRMAHAQRLLAGTDLPIADVAARCGYARPGQFGVAFKRRCGMTPTQFRAGRP